MKVAMIRPLKGRGLTNSLLMVLPSAKASSFASLEVGSWPSPQSGDHVILSKAGHEGTKAPRQQGMEAAGQTSRSVAADRDVCAPTQLDTISSFSPSSYNYSDDLSSFLLSASSGLIQQRSVHHAA